ncbi:MAG: ATP-binding protein [Pseudomonadota bacterium]
MPASIAPLKPKDLRREFDPKLVPFDSSDQSPECMEPVVGQDRAKEALEFGLAMRDMEYHVFVAGNQRTGKTHLVRSFVERIARQEPPPPDWVYVHNFRNPDQPRALRLATGQGKDFAKDMAGLVEWLKNKLPAIFESDDYTSAREELVNGFKRNRAQLFQGLDQEARERGYLLRFESTGIMMAPMGEDGEPLAEASIRDLSEEKRAELRGKSDYLQQRVGEVLRQVGGNEKELNAALRELDRTTVLAAAGHVLDELFDKYAEQREVLVYLEQVREDIADNFERFKKKEQPQLPFAMPTDDQSFREYQVNVFVDNSETEGVPVVVVNHPTHPNLFGRIERQAQFGALVTDFTLLRAGALHKANGGYLVLPALDLLRLWLPWEALKRALKERQVVMEDVLEQMGYMSTRTLRPEPIPLDFKVILVGETQLYHLLYAYDPQFPKLFKVRAQMADRMEWGEAEVTGFINHLCTIGRSRDMMPINRHAVARLIELAAEISGDRERLTLQLAVVEDILKEANFFAQKDGRREIGAEDVQTAVDKRRYRSSMLEERMREGVTRGFFNVETTGAKVGQVNGLAVLDQGDHAFGQPERISAALGLGREGLINIERESDLSGPFHTKGMLILAGFLRDRYAGNGPLALTASLVFEQSYGGVDGDSATIAETLALISRIAGAPLRQDLAVTGSMDQRGQAQAIGGVNVKIEGFFRLCAARGLTGSQGVVIPASNVKNLMLPQEIVAAVKKKKFNIYAVDHLDQALELFTGLAAGERGKSGKYPKGTVNYLVEQELERLRELARKAAEKPAAKKKAKKPAAKPAGKGRK